MGSWYPLVILIALVFLVISLVGLLDTLARIYAAAAAFSPLLANGLLGMLLLLGVAIAAGFAYYGWLFLRPQRQRRPPAPPQSAAAAVAANLTATQQQVAQIHDQVSRQALEADSHRLAATLEQGDWTLVVFGVGSVGKTSLVNYILGESAGAVAVAMGTTQEPQSYRLELAGSERGLVLVDTPGLAEAGVAGTLREQAARQLAAEADLLLFVIDDDLRQLEYTILQALLAMGKRVLVVLNKADRFLAADLDQVLQQVRARLPMLAPEDVVAIAVAPPALPLADGGWFQQDPDGLPLLERLAEVLRQEGETLIADNILLQTQRLNQTATAQLEAQRRAQAEAIVERYQWIVAGVIAVTPLPGMDLLATAAVNGQMVIELGRVYGCSISIAEGKQLALALAKTLAGLGLVKGALELLALGLQTNVATVLAGRGLQGLGAAYLTRIAGLSFIQYFQQAQDWGDGGMAAVIESQFRLNRRETLIRDFIQDYVVSRLPS